MNKHIVIVGCGDVGFRIAQLLIDNGESSDSIITLVRSGESQQKLCSKGLHAQTIDFDYNPIGLSLQSIEEMYYLVPPQKSDYVDKRSKHFLQSLQENSVNLSLKKIVLISTTGVYGDCDGENVTEETPINPTTDRSKRRADMENQWRDFSDRNNVLLSILRVPGIYSFSRLPRKRLESNTPIVNPELCGLTNRIHADDLAMICRTVMQEQTQSDVFNVSDGVPGTISQYLMDVAEFLDLPKPEVVNLEEGYRKISTGMMSYISESRKIDNTKLINRFNLTLSYPCYREGIRF